jgi:hypothetical protein
MYNYNTVSDEASQSKQVTLCKFLMICIIQIDAGLLSWHDQLPW